MTNPLRTLTALGGLAALLLLAPGVHAAPIEGGGTTKPLPVACTNPAAAVCSDPAVMNKVWPIGSCGAEQRKVCGARLRAQWTSAAGASGTPSLEFLPDTEAMPRPPIAANLLPGRSEAFDASTLRVLSSADGTFAVDPLAQRLGRFGLSDAQKEAFRPGLQYRFDGAEVNSCSEYAYKRFWDYAELQSDIAMCERNSECIFQAIYTGPRAIASRSLSMNTASAGGLFLYLPTPIDPQIELVQDGRRRNPFASLPTDALLDSPDPATQAKIVAVRAKVAAMKAYSFTHGKAVTPSPKLVYFDDEWAWHKAMHDRTANVTPAEFQEFRRRKIEMEAALADWHAAWKAVGSGVIHGNVPNVVFGPLRARIQKAMFAELDLGNNSCFENAQYGCDWSPAEFEDRFTHLYGAEMNDAYKDCTELVGTSPFTAAVPADARRDVRTYKTWSDARKAALKKQFKALPIYPGTSLGDGVIGSKTANSGSFGNPSLFSAGYDYSINWKVKKTAQRSAADNRACAFKGQLDLLVHADASMLGQNVAGLVGKDHVVDSETRVALDPAMAGGQAQISSRTQVMGFDLYDAQSSVPTLNLASDMSESSPHATATFVIVIVPVTFEAWGELRFGIKSEVGGHATNTCSSNANPDFGITANLTPYAHVDAIGTLAVGVPGFQLGVKGELSLIHVDVPITGGVSMGQLPNGSPTLAFDTTGKLKLSELSGRFSIFAEALLFTYETEIFTFDGFHQDVGLWSSGSSVELDAFRSVPVQPVY